MTSFVSFGTPFGTPLRAPNQRSGGLPILSAAQNFSDGDIGAALSRAGLPHNHPIRAVLDAEAQIVGVRDAAVNCQGETLDSRIDQLRRDERFSHTFPQPAAKIAKSDLRELARNFDAVAAGTAVVE